MVTFNAEIERFSKMGEKTGWSYVFIHRDLAEKIKPGCRKSFRVKGFIDQTEIKGMATVPMGEGHFIIALKSSLRKKIRKEEGAEVSLQLEEDPDFKIEIPQELHLCLSDEPELYERFLALPMSHRNYYINWVNAAKTEPTKTKRLVKILAAMDRKLSFSEMMREDKESGL